MEICTATTPVACLSSELLFCTCSRLSHFPLSVDRNSIWRDSIVAPAYSAHSSKCWTDAPFSPVPSSG